jgi:hypothetical protein
VLDAVDACLKDALSLVPEVPAQLEIDGKMRSSEQFLVGFLCQLLSTLLVVPVRHLSEQLSDLLVDLFCTMEAVTVFFFYQHHLCNIFEEIVGL